MMIIKLFENDQCQADCLPKESKWAGFLNSLEMFSDDFMDDGREQPPAQAREPF